MLNDYNNIYIFNYIFQAHNSNKYEKLEKYKNTEIFRKYTFLFCFIIIFRHHEYPNLSNF